MSKQGTMIGYTTGVFDLFHIGHLNILEEAKKHCDYLIVGVVTDELCEEIKSKRPVIPYGEREKIVRAIRYVDEVVAQSKIDELGDWERLGFNRIFKGSDWKESQKWCKLEIAFAERGVDVQFFPYTKTTSSSLLKDILLSIDVPAS